MFFLFCCSLLAQDQDLEESSGIGIMAYKFELKSFSIDTSEVYSGGKIMECKGNVLKKSIIGKSNLNLSELTLTSENQARYLIPSFKPFVGRASWRINSSSDDKTSCMTLAPYFNGMGFSSFDVRNGQATIYLASFEIGSEQIHSWTEDSAINRLSSLLNPDYVIGNYISFPAQCVLSVPNTLASIISNTEMVCTLDENRGEVKLRAVKISPDIPDMKLVDELVNNQGLLYGEIQQPPQ